MKLKKIVAVLLLVVLTIASTGCGTEKKTTDNPQKQGKQTAEQSNKDSDSAEQKTDELAPLTISIGFWSGGDQFVEDDPILQDISKRFNVTFENIGVSWSDYKEKYKLWAASGELPDVFAVDELNTETYGTWIDQGIVRALPDDLSKYPNIEKIMNQEDVIPLKKNGKYYMIPRVNYPTTDLWLFDRGAVIRKDWLEKLGLEVPKTFEDYKKVLKAFVENDPDGNGQKDTVGLTHKSIDMLQVFFLGSVPQVTNDGWVKEDGQWIPGYYSKNLVKGIEQFKELYDEGLLDKDFAILKTNDGQDKFAQGKAGILTQQVGCWAIRDIKEKWVKYDHDIAFEDAVAILPAWQHEDGNTYSFTQTTYWSESYFNGDIDDEKMDRILMIYDYLQSPEFREIKVYGVEGVDYTKDGDEYTILLEKDEHGMYMPISDKYPCLNVFSGLVSWGGDLGLEKNELNIAIYGESVIEMVDDFRVYCKENVTPAPLNFDVKLMSTPAKDKLSAIRFMDDVTKVIMADGDVETEWEKIREGYNEYGIENAIKEVNDKVKE